MRKEDLKITELDNGFSVEVTGRANFDYAVPLRELGSRLGNAQWLQIDLENCEAMDSTFMGVLTMLALKFRKKGQQVMLLGASDTLLKLLRDLGVAKLFNVVSDSPACGKGVAVETPENSGLLAAAETVAEAHRTLVEADESNAEKFKQVIEFADQDVARLRNGNK